SPRARPASPPRRSSDLIRLASQAGLVGGSIEDATGDPAAPIHDFALAVERVRAAAEAARDLPMVLTARADNFLWGRPDLADTIQIGRAHVCTPVTCKSR